MKICMNFVETVCQLRPDMRKKVKIHLVLHWVDWSNFVLDLLSIVLLFYECGFGILGVKPFQSHFSDIKCTNNKPFHS